MVHLILPIRTELDPTADDGSCQIAEYHALYLPELPRQGNSKRQHQVVGSFTDSAKVATCLASLCPTSFHFFTTNFSVETLYLQDNLEELFPRRS
jgi:hypothetical protein